MTKKAKKNALTLIGLDIEGEWNLPLIENAAEMNGTDLKFARHKLTAAANAMNSNSVVQFDEELLRGFDNVVVCETGKESRNVFYFAVPRGRTALIVGNELEGIPRSICKKADHMVSVPMCGIGVSSINVAAAAAVCLYAFKRNMGRNKFRGGELTIHQADVLIFGATDPSELGSLFRSAWAFGCKRIFLADRANIWFNADREVKLAGRAAARQKNNSLVVLPVEQLDFNQYDQVILCNDERHGTALSGLTASHCRKPLLVYGAGEFLLPDSLPIEQVYVDFDASGIEPRFRHSGSIFLSVMFEMGKRRKRG